MKAVVKKSWRIWVLFVALCLIWGSSFILMKMGMYRPDGASVLSAYQVAALRMLSAGIVLSPFALRALRRLPDSSTGWYIFNSGLLGSFFPAFLFCIAETRINSSLAGTINAITPLFTLVVSALIYKTVVPTSKWVGIFIGFCGSLLLFIAGNYQANFQSGYIWFAVLATICYGLNVNMVRHRLQYIGSRDIAALAFVFLIPPSFLVLWYTHYFQLPLAQTDYLMATASAITLGVLGTAIASILFYVLVKKAGIVFSSLVTYGIPFVAIGWGLIYGEKIGSLQVLALVIILAGVYVANRNWGAKKIPATHE